MLPIDFDDQLQADAAEIGSVGRDRIFTPEFLSAAATRTQPLPECTSKLVAHPTLLPSERNRVFRTGAASRCGFTFHRVTLVHIAERADWPPYFADTSATTALTPSPSPPPGRGEHGSLGLANIVSLTRCVDTNVIILISSPSVDIHLSPINLASLEQTGRLFASEFPQMWRRIC